MFNAKERKTVQSVHRSTKQISCICVPYTIEHHPPSVTHPVSS